jgi:hypothetical protein
MALYTSWLFGASFVNIWAIGTRRQPEFIAETIVVLVVIGIGEIAVALWARDPIITAVGTWTVYFNYSVNHDVAMLGSAGLALTIILGVVSGLIWIERICRLDSRLYKSLVCFHGSTLLVNAAS